MDTMTDPTDPTPALDDEGLDAFALDDSGRRPRSPARRSMPWRAVVRRLAEPLEGALVRSAGSPPADL